MAGASEPCSSGQAMSIRPRLKRLWPVVGRLLIPLLALSFAPAPVHAQDDGARLYMMVPEATTIASVRLHQLHSKLAVDPGVVADDDLDTTLGVFQFVQALKIAGGQSFIFLVVPASRIDAPFPIGADGSDSVTGLGDAQLGFVLGVKGTPSLSPEDYAAHPPGLAVNLLGKIFFPTGKYSSDRSINVGANRWALRLGVPIVYAIGERMADPQLTTVELMPTVTFFGVNDDPFDADRTKQDPLFIFEGHLTRGFTSRLWGSIDLLWRRGGEVAIDGIDGDNPQHALSLGATGTLSVGRNMSLRLSYGRVVDRNAFGPDGWLIRTIFGVVF
jgi:hypothetical protein